VRFTERFGDFARFRERFARFGDFARFTERFSDFMRFGDFARFDDFRRFGDFLSILYNNKKLYLKNVPY